MVTDPHFQLTTRDHAILQAMLEQHSGPYDAWVTLLERKVRESTLYFRDDIPPGVVTLGTKLTYLVDGVVIGPHVVVQDADGDISGALSLRSLRGLALLGLAERAALRIETGAGGAETVQVHEVLSQPEAEARAAARPVQNVVSFRPRRAGPAIGFDPDDDPGPSAA
ncbi:transcription elongation factor GreAB [Aquamicrobium terrae]